MKRINWPQILTPLAASACLLGIPAVAFSQTHPADQVLRDMQQAARQGQQARLTQLLPAAKGHPLEVWAAYWELKARLKTANATEVEQFLQRWRGTYLEDRLRNDWLLLLGERRNWPEFTRLHADFRMQDDKQLQCYDLAIASQQGRAPADAASNLTALWLDQPNNDDGCTYAAGQLHAQGVLPAPVLWQRARLGAERKQQASTRAALAHLAASQPEDVPTLFNAPDKYLARPGINAEMATLALIRLAATTPEQAAGQLRGAWAQKLSQEQRDWVWAVAGKTAAGRLSPQAMDYFKQIRTPNGLHHEHLAWMARAALRAGQWPQVERAIATMPASSRSDATWSYWQARALLEQRQHPQYEQRSIEADQLLRSIANVNGFYEQLALEAVGLRITAPAEPAPPTAQELAQAEQHPGLSRALYAIRIGLRPEGVREWNYSTNLHQRGGMADRELLAAAERACQAQVWDRCINTSERTRSFTSWKQRYPMPFAQEVIARSNSIGLDPAYVYGLIRQESRFIMDARSHVGASGLMQVMPATAQWTAKKIGMADFKPHMINQHDVNITIGTAYLKLALDDFAGSMVLAAAGYNAGPGRPRNWRNGPVLEAAIWAENVPFTETRDYVKKVLANTTNYAAHISGQPQSLRQRLGMVGP